MHFECVFLQQVCMRSFSFKLISDLLLYFHMDLDGKQPCYISKEVSKF